MSADALTPLSGHAVLLLLVELAAMLVIARIGAELMKRVGLPAVVGELAAGIFLGPTVFGHFAPNFFRLVFPPVSAQFHLLETVSTIGMVLLMMLTGVETDLKLLRNLGKPALVASVFGMVVPFAFGLVLGWWMPESFVAQPDHRILFALFLATAMSISAMPVIAKILMDLDLTRRNIGVVILSAGVVDDTTGWFVLSAIAGASRGDDNKLTQLLKSMGGTALFLLACVFIIFPLLKWGIRITRERFQSKDSDLVLMLVVTFLCAAATDLIGIHAVFGAFVAGCMIGQVPRLPTETLHKLESVTFAVFAPIFFALVGIRVDLWRIGGGTMLAIVLGVATAGKLIGCTAGSLLGGLRFWESLSIAVAMNARGAMELVVATIGLSLGILNQEMYSIVVMVAVTTSFVAPLGLRLTMRGVRMTEEEADRIAAENAKGLFDPQTLRVLVPTSGGPNAFMAARLALRLTRASANPVGIIYVEQDSNWLGRLWRRLRPRPTGTNLSQHLDEIKADALLLGTRAPEVRHQVGSHVASSISEEAGHGYDLVLIGSGRGKPGVQGDLLEDLVEQVTSHVAIAKRAPDANGEIFQRILVPVDGSLVSRVATEFAIRYAEGVGEGAEVTIAYVHEARSARSEPSGITPPPMAAMPASGPGPTPESTTGPTAGSTTNTGSWAANAGLERISPIFRTTKVRTTLISIQYGLDTDRHPVLEEVTAGKYDLLVLGAENRAIHNRLFFGFENERLLAESPISLVVVVPKVSSRHTS